MDFNQNAVNVFFVQYQAENNIIFSFFYLFKNLNHGLSFYCLTNTSTIIWHLDNLQFSVMILIQAYTGTRYNLLANWDSEKQRS